MGNKVDFGRVGEKKTNIIKMYYLKFKTIKELIGKSGWGWWVSEL